jgi:hypothetical protein
LKISRLLYALARRERDLESLRSPRTAVKRQRNKLIGRIAARLLGRIYR